MKDIELAKIFGLSTSTLSDWKNNKRDGKYILYRFLNSCSEEAITKKVDAIKLLDDIKIVGVSEFKLDFINNINRLEQFREFEVTGVDFLNPKISNILILKNSNGEYSVVIFNLTLGSNYQTIDKFYLHLVKFKAENPELTIDHIYLVNRSGKPVKFENAKEDYNLDITTIGVLEINREFYGCENVVFWKEVPSQSVEFFKMVSKMEFIRHKFSNN
jgi:hypothetical protein